MKLPLKNPMLVSCRAKGHGGAVRELSAIIDFNAEYSVILARDALALGYIEAGIRPKEWRNTHPDRVPMLLDLRGIERGNLVTLKEVSVGPLTAEEVDAVVVELGFPRAAPFDFVLGRSFLKDFRLEVDMKQGVLTLA